MQVKKQQTRKELETLLQKYLGEIDALKLEMTNKKKEIDGKESAIKGLRDKINQLTQNGAKPTVSEHALLRYLERIENVDLEAARNTILNEKVLKLIETLGGNGEYPSNDFTIVMKNNVVVTIKTNGN